METFGAASRIPAGNSNKREGKSKEGSLCKRFCCRVKESTETDQMSSIKLIKNQRLKKNLLKSWDHMCHEAILIQPSSFSPVNELQTQQERSPMTAQSQIEFPQARTQHNPSLRRCHSQHPRILQLSQRHPMMWVATAASATRVLTRRAAGNAHPLQEKRSIQLRAALFSCTPFPITTFLLASARLEQKAGLQLSSFSLGTKVSADGNAAQSSRGM